MGWGFGEAVLAYAVSVVHIIHLGQNPFELTLVHESENPQPQTALLARENIKIEDCGFKNREDVLMEEDQTSEGKKWERRGSSQRKT